MGHVLVTGCGLGSERVINALTHHSACTTSLLADGRMRFWDFLLDVDQHVRNAAIILAPLGFSLAAYLGLGSLAGVSIRALWIVLTRWFWQV